VNEKIRVAQDSLEWLPAQVDAIRNEQEMEI
jgi:hypothetical protein